MNHPNSSEQLQAIIGLSAEQRFDYFVEQALATGLIWTLRGDGGGVLMSSEGKDCIPVWPSEAFAELWVEGDWSDCAPSSIDLDAWLQRWLPGMQADGLNVVVFPDEAEEGLVLRPKDLKKAMQSSQD